MDFAKYFSFNFKKEQHLLAVLTVCLAFLVSYIAITIYAQQLNISALRNENKAVLQQLRELKTVPLTETQQQNIETDRQKKYFFELRLPNYSTLSAVITSPTKVSSIQSAGDKSVLFTTNGEAFLLDGNQSVQLNLSDEFLPCTIDPTAKLTVKIIPSMSVVVDEADRRLAVSSSCAGYGHSHFVGLYSYTTGTQIKLTNPNQVKMKNYLGQIITVGEGFAGGELVTNVPDYVNVVTVKYDYSGFAVFDSKTGVLIDTLFFANY
jgi:hypothetical protein